jgi:hypothetical protein
MRILFAYLRDEDFARFENLNLGFECQGKLTTGYSVSYQACQCLRSELLLVAAMPAEEIFHYKVQALFKSDFENILRSILSMYFRFDDGNFRLILCADLLNPDRYGHEEIYRNPQSIFYPSLLLVKRIMPSAKFYSSFQK